jgi:Rieske Fe-S protein
MPQGGIRVNEELSRRQFLHRLTVMSVGTALLSLPVDAAPVPFLPVGKVAAFKTGAYILITLPGGVPVQVRRLPGHAPKFQALSARCTHKGCTVAWGAADRQFRCPCHGGRFDALGRNISGPPPSPLPTLATKVVRGVLWVALPSAVYGAPGKGRLSG